MSLNKKQNIAANILTGNVLCKASAGSGKTFTMCHRIKNMIDSGIPAQSIMACTFTKLASMELEERIRGLIDHNSARTMTIGTMHSIFLSVLKNNCNKIGYNSITLMKSWQKKKFILNALKANRITVSESINTKSLLSEISYIKNLGVTTLDKDMFTRVANKRNMGLTYIVYKMYEENKARELLIDFDDMLLLTRKLLKEHKTVLKYYQGIWKHFLVDEFQDTNSVQYELILLLSNGNNLFVVGDFKQAIYGFRGASMKFIQAFHEELNKVKVVELDTTYRCRKVIADKSNLLSDIMDDIPVKSIKEGGVVEYLGRYHNLGIEAKNIAYKIKGLLNSDNSPELVRVLYRMNFMSAFLENWLLKLNIPYKIHGAPLFFERKDIASVINYCRVLKDPNKIRMKDLLSILDVPNRYLGAKVKQEIANHFESAKYISLDDCFNVSLSRKSAHAQFKMLIEKLNHLRNVNLTPMKLISIVRKLFKIDKWLLEEAMSDDDDDFTSEALNQVELIASEYDTLDEFIAYIDSYIHNYIKANSKVELSTIHKVKGLEADVVFIAGVSEGLLPHAKSSIESERNLMYVALTRAKDACYISGVRTLFKKVLKKSPFIGELKL